MSTKPGDRVEARLWHWGLMFKFSVRTDIRLMKLAKHNHIILGHALLLTRRHDVTIRPQVFTLQIGRAPS